MRFLIHILSKYTLSSLLIVLIWILCFCTTPKTALNNVSYIDKWTHIVMYFGTCTIIWIQYHRQHLRVEWLKAISLAWAAPIVMSGVIELLQAYCTGGRRSGEWLDFAANATGATLGLIVGILLANRLSKF